MAVSSGDFFVPASPYIAADVQVTGRMAVGETKNITITTANKIALIVFEGTAGQRVSLQMSAVTISSSSVKIYNPDGTISGSAAVSTSGGFIDAMTLPVTGTYTILIDPAGTYTGSMTLALYNVVDVTGTITAGGAAVTATTSTPGQNARLTFSGLAGQRISLQMSAVTISSSTVSMYNPDGTIFASAGVGTSGGFIDAKSLPVTGTYTILIDPVGTYTGSMTLTLYNVVDVTGTITAGGPAVTVTTTIPGQNALLTFSGTAGQRASLYMSASLGTSVTIYNPDGTNLASASASFFGVAFIDTKVLPATGSYTILVDPLNTTTGNATVILYDVPPDITVTITIGGPSVIVTIATPGQNGMLTFEGTSGQQVTIRITSNTMGAVTVALLKPDSTSLTSATSLSSSFTLATQTLPTAGTYTISIDPSGANTGSMNVSVTSP